MLDLGPGGTRCFFVSDLHGRRDRYRKLMDAVADERPAAVFLGGDLLPSALSAWTDTDDAGFIAGYLTPELASLRRQLGERYPRFFLVFGNDDERLEEPKALAAAEIGLLDYTHGRRIDWLDWSVYGYACIPPSPFRLKDWERYDVSRFVDPGCIPPEEGLRTIPEADGRRLTRTIAEELDILAGEDDLTRGICLFHCPPYRSHLDRAALDGRMIDHVPVDVNIGSIAIRRFIETRRPLLGLHGHVHESARITGYWRDRIGRTLCFSAAHDGPELALVRFDPGTPGDAERQLL